MAQVGQDTASGRTTWWPLHCCWSAAIGTSAASIPAVGAASSSHCDALGQSCTLGLAVTLSCVSSAASQSSSAFTKEGDSDREAARARITELESQIEGMIEHMSSREPQDSGRLQQLETERDAAQARIAELEGQVEAMIEQIGSSADEAVVALETDIVFLKKELHDAQQDSAHTHSMAAEAVELLEQTKRERNAFQQQVHRLCCALSEQSEAKEKCILLSKHGRSILRQQLRAETGQALLCSRIFAVSQQCKVLPNGIHSQHEAHRCSDNSALFCTHLTFSMHSCCPFCML